MLWFSIVHLHFNGKLPSWQAPSWGFPCALALTPWILWSQRRPALGMPPVTGHPSTGVTSKLPCTYLCGPIRFPGLLLLGHLRKGRAWTQPPGCSTRQSPWVLPDLEYDQSRGYSYNISSSGNPVPRNSLRFWKTEPESSETNFSKARKNKVYYLLELEKKT